MTVHTWTSLCAELRRQQDERARKDREPKVRCSWCKRDVPLSEMNTVPWGEGKTARICDRCCDESA
jgi:hypothetical protein